VSATLAEKLAGFNPHLPLERAQTIPASWYSDPEIHEAERRSVFGGTWQMVGRVDQLSKPCSYLTADVAGEPILVVRDGEGHLRAFHNVCRHRAARVATGECGEATRLRCPYHGWTYDLHGRLRGTPEFDGALDFRKEDNGLVPLVVDTWGPFVWVHTGPAAISLREFLNPLPAPTGLHFVERREYRLACNWKVFVDNYLDGGYHVNSVHPGLAEVLDYSHYRTEVHGNTAVQYSPMKPAGGEVGQVRTGKTAAYWWVFPNFMMNLYEGVMDTNLVLPLGPGACRVVFDFYFAHTRTEADREFIAESIRVADLVQKEDVGICEDVQRGLGSRSYHTGRFSVRREAAGYHFHRLLARQLQQET